MPNTIKQISLNDDDRHQLEMLIRQGTAEARKHIRAKILLLKADNKSNESIADKLDVSISTVRLCLEKFVANGIQAALEDEKGRGRKAEITDADISWVISKACQKPKDCGYTAEFWYPASFTRFIRESAEQEGHPRMATVSETKLRTILAEAKLRPFKVTYYCERRDPDFDAKMHDVLVIYKQLSLQFDENGMLLPCEETPVHVVSYDEKPGMQVLSVTTEDKAPAPEQMNGAYIRDYEYVRHGTLSLLAAIDLQTGEAIPLVSETHKSADFVCFLQKLDAKYPTGDKIRLILDNHSAHTSQETQRYLNTVPNRFEFVFTPKHGSWLNLIEGFFSKLTKQMLNGIRVKDKEELVRRLYQYFEEVNKVPVPYRWKYKLEEIDLAKEDISKIVYEVVNRKAALKDFQTKRAPEQRTRNKKSNFV